MIVPATEVRRGGGRRRTPGERRPWPTRRSSIDLAVRSASIPRGAPGRHALRECHRRRDASEVLFRHDGTEPVSVVQESASRAGWTRSTERVLLPTLPAVGLGLAPARPRARTQRRRVGDRQKRTRRAARRSVRVGMCSRRRGARSGGRRPQTDGQGTPGDRHLATRRRQAAPQPRTLRTAGTTPQIVMTYSESERGSGSRSRSEAIDRRDRQAD